MKDRLIAPLVFVAVAAAMALLIFVSPSLESSQTKAHKEAARQVEAARRVLAGYNAHTALILAVTQSAVDRGLWPAIDADGLARLAKDNSRDFQEIDQVVRDFAGAYDRPSGIAPDGSRELLQAWGWPESMIEGGFFARGQFGRREAELIRALGGERPEDTVPELRQLGSAPEQQAQAVAAALERLNREMNDNVASLEEAERLLLAATSEDPDSVQAQQLLANVHYLLGVRQRLAALALRQRAEQLRPEIARLSSEWRRVQATAAAVEERRGINASIDEVGRTITGLQQELAEQEEVVAAARSARDAMLAQVENLRAERDRADQRYLELTEAGAPGRQAGDFSQRIRAIKEAGAALNEASRRLEETELGTLRDATYEEDDETGEGRFVPAEEGGSLGYEGGLPALERDVAVAEARFAALQAALNDAQQHVERLGAIRTALAEAVARDTARAEALAEQLHAVIDECEQLRSAASAAEEDALSRRIEPCLRAVAQGERAQTTRIGDASGTAGGAAADRLEMISGEKWVSAGLSGLGGEAQLLAAAIYQQRLADLISHRAALAPAAESGLPGLQKADLEGQIEEARALTAEKAYAAAEAFQKASRAEGFWVYQGGMGIALAMLAQLDPANEEYRTAAIEALEASIDGRADHPAATRLGAALRKLQSDGNVPTSETPDETEGDADANG